MVVVVEPPALVVVVAVAHPAPAPVVAAVLVVAAHPQRDQILSRSLLRMLVVRQRLPKGGFLGHRPAGLVAAIDPRPGQALRPQTPQVLPVFSQRT